MTEQRFTYDITLPNGIVTTISVVSKKPYLVVETRLSNNLIYHYWNYATPTGASVQMRRLLERQQEDAKRFTNFNINEALFQLASPKEMD